MDIKHQIIFDLIKEYKADSFISTSPVNREWLLNNVAIDFSLILAKNNKIHVFVDERDIASLKKNNHKIIVHLYKDVNSWLDFCKAQKLHTTLFESNAITYDQYDIYAKPLKTKLVSINADDLRIVKTKEELSKLQKSADIICKAIEHLKKWVKVGVSEKEVAKELYKFVIKNGATNVSFPTIVSFGSNSADIHSSPTDRKLKRNEIILVDAGCIYEGFCSDITRIWWIGKLSPMLMKMYQTVLHANKLGIQSIKANVIGSKIDNICRTYIKKNWNNYDIPHGVGHGVGMLIHENPRINKIYHKPLLENSVVTIEPGIYDPSIGGVRVEDTIVVTRNGAKVLTSKSLK